MKTRGQQKSGESVVGKLDKDIGGGFWPKCALTAIDVDPDGAAKWRHFQHNQVGTGDHSQTAQIAQEIRIIVLDASHVPTLTNCQFGKRNARARADMTVFGGDGRTVRIDLGIAHCS